MYYLEDTWSPDIYLKLQHLNYVFANCNSLFKMLLNEKASHKAFSFRILFIKTKMSTPLQVHAGSLHFIGSIKIVIKKYSVSLCPHKNTRSVSLFLPLNTKL